MQPTPDFTEVWNAVNRGFSSITTMRMVDALNTALVVSCVLSILSFIVVILAIRYRKSIKRFLNL